MAYRDAFEARIALAEKPAKQLAQNRIANAALLPVLKQLLASEVTGPWVKDYLDKAYPNWASRGVSVVPARVRPPAVSRSRRLRSMSSDLL